VAAERHFDFLVIRGQNKVDIENVSSKREAEIDLFIMTGGCRSRSAGGPGATQ
jgi:hypothetical protein